MRVDCKRAGKSGRRTLSSSETAPLKPKDGLSGPPACNKNVEFRNSLKNVNVKVGTARSAVTAFLCGDE
jgi:hypothetical protein